MCCDRRGCGLRAEFLVDTTGGGDSLSLTELSLTVSVERFVASNGKRQTSKHLSFISVTSITLLEASTRLFDAPASCYPWFFDSSGG